MTTVAEFTLPADEFPLGTIFAELPGVTVRLERVIPDANGVVPYFWVQGTDTDEMVEKFSDHPGVRDIRAVDRVNDEHLMRCAWVAEHDQLLDALIAPEIVLLSAIGTEAEWTFELRGEDRAAIAQFQEYCHDHDVPVTLSELHALRALDINQELTDSQREALRIAEQRGYFETPRTVSLEEIGDELGISHQAVASRIRRGTRHLVQNALDE